MLGNRKAKTHPTSQEVCVCGCVYVHMLCTGILQALLYPVGHTCTYNVLTTSEICFPSCLLAYYAILTAPCFSVHDR